MLTLKPRHLKHLNESSVIGLDNTSNPNQFPSYCDSAVFVPHWLLFSWSLQA